MLQQQAENVLGWSSKWIGQNLITIEETNSISGLNRVTVSTSTKIDKRWAQWMEHC